MEKICVKHQQKKDNLRDKLYDKITNNEKMSTMEMEAWYEALQEVYEKGYIALQALKAAYERQWS